MKPNHGQISLSGLNRCTMSLLVCSITLLSSCKPPLPDTVRSGLVYCSEGSPESFNPQLVTSGTTIDAISQQLYDRLLDIDASSGELKPALASSWQVSDNGKVYHFSLQSQVAFHKTEYFQPSRR